MTNSFRVVPIKRRVKAHRANGIYKSNNPFIWVNPGEPPELEGLGEFAGETLALVSRNTPLWDVPKPRYIQVPSTFRPLKKPAQPIQRPFFPPVMSARRKGSSDKAWERYVRKYNARLALARDKYAAYLIKFKARYDLYLQRLANYEERTKRRDFVYYLTVAKLAGTVVIPQYNPHSRTKIKDTGWIIDFTYRETFKTVLSGGYNYTQPGPGPYVNRENRIDGVTDIVPYVGWTYDHPFPELPGSPAPSGELVFTAEWDAINQLYEKIGDQAVHVGNMLAERAQTFSMFVSSFERLKNFLHSPKSAVMGYLGSGVTKRVANDFLQYCFGVEPFAKDVYNSVVALSKLGDKSPDFVKVKGRGISSDSSFEVIEHDFYSDEVSTSTTVTVRYVAEYTINSAIANSLRNYGLTNPAEIAWEVLPWSFVVDWFIPIGNYVASLTADQHLTFRVGTRSISTKTVRTTRRTYKRTPYLYEELGKDYSGTIQRTVETEVYERELLKGPPAVRLPRFKSPFSLRHMALSLALWRQRR